MKQISKWFILLVGLLTITLAACTGPTGTETEPTDTPTTDTPATDTAVPATEVEEATPEAEAETELAEDPLSSTAWVLESMTDSSGTAVTLVPDSIITAEFLDGSLGGNAGCNSYFGSYILDGNNLTISDTGSTMMFCEPEELMAQETAYLAALGMVSQYGIENGQLVLADAEGNAMLTFSAKEVETATVGLTDVTWLVHTLNIGNDAVSSVLSGTRLTAVFNADGTVSGAAGCNNFNGSYTTDGSNITIGPLASTMMACAEDVMQQETAYLAALQSAATYQITGESLELFTADGRLAVAFNVEPPQTLAGSSWDVISYNNGNEAVVSVIIGTEMTAIFGEDGSLTGSAGCNSYSATYEATEDTITIGPATATRMFCESPEGTMEQEAQYLAALETAATYSINGDMLEMRTADGAMVASFQQAGFVDPEVRAFLENATYKLEQAASGTVTLVNGEYREPIADTGSELVVTLTDHVATGELNGQSTAAVITADPGGSGTFYYLALFTPDEAGLTNVATILLGDRVMVNSVTITQNTVVVDMVQAGPDDPLCCPTQQVVNVYELQGEELVLLSSTPVEQ